MVLKQVRVVNFRSHDDFTIEMGSRSNLITGDNGSGKTSLLEAIYIGLQGSSFRSSDKEIVKSGSEYNWYRVDVIDDSNSLRIVRFDASKDSSRKQFEVDGKKNYRLPLKSRVPVVLFEPADLQLISGSPARRRQFIDRLLSQIDPTFKRTLTKYDKSLRQRNNLLKSSYNSSDLLFPWNVILAEAGSEIINRRREMVERLNQQINQTYYNITGVKDNIEITYSSEEISKSQALKNLVEAEERDRLLGFTSFGPHKHDIEFIFNGAAAVSTASRGETRCLILGLKFLETDILSQELDTRPIILLDDVFGELDKNRQVLLTEYFSHYQTILTSVDDIEVDGVKVRL